MTAAGDQTLAWAYTQVGVTEQPPNSNNVPYWDPWGGNYGAWCAAFVSYGYDATGTPLPPIDGAPGFSYCPSGQIAAFTTGHSVGEGGVEPGDTLIFSWEPWFYGADGVAYCSSGAYAGAPAGDHTGYFAGWLGGGYMRTVEGNTSQSSWDNGGAVMERTDRYTGQICCYARHAALGAGGGTQGEMFTVGQYEDIMGQLQALSVEMGQHTQGVYTRIDQSDDRTLRAARFLRLVENRGALHFTDGVSTFHARSPEIVGHAKNLGWLDNDLDGDGNPITQGIPDELFDSLQQIDVDD